MKKSKMMRLASCLLVLTLLSTCMISGTFAKYVTAGEGTDTARVAKFGVKVTANGGTFAKEYDTHDAIFTEAKSVISTENVVAPGTTGEMTKMTLSGQPEVAVRVSYEGKFDITDAYWMVDGAYYCPLQIVVNGTAYNGTAYGSAAEFENAVNGAIAAYTKDYPAGTDLATVTGDSVAVTWTWPFSTSDANDVKDTKLGDQAAQGNHGTVTMAVKTTVTQID